MAKHSFRFTQIESIFIYDESESLCKMHEEARKLLTPNNKCYNYVFVISGFSYCHDHLSSFARKVRVP